ncbi:TRAP transporter small permease [Marispirochaeta sp.]|jgi:TRAP-type C4-dicarboxylate transport system permease small subunit|uniref:TRAP transporter small permease n=1 Tax=Marispirochaeta sp. TaxID=2038653 RepID=UPI0029C70AD6|nr:TRAP transporter small permease [Marispirochaeta sp.]
MKGIVAVEGRISLFLESLVTVFFGIILLLTILLVILRYLFNTSIIGGNELMEFLFIYTTALGAAVSLGKRSHIKVTYFIDRLPEIPKAVVDTFSLTLVLGINAVMLRLSFPWIAKVGSSASPVLRLPSWIAMISVPVGCTLAVLYCAFDIYKIWFSHDKPEGGLA